MKPHLEKFLNEHYDEIKDISHKITEKSNNDSHAEDILHDVLMYVDTYNEEFLKKLEERGELKYFIVRAIQTQISSKKSKTYSTYRKHLNNTDPNIVNKLKDRIKDSTKSEDELNEIFYKTIESSIKECLENKFNNLQKIVFKKYVSEFANQVELGKASNLSTQYISNILQKCAKKLNEEIQTDYPEFTIKGRLKMLKPFLKNVLNDNK